MIYHCIRRIGTQDYLPNSKQGRGFTHDEPVKDGGPRGPRLFKKKQAATQALQYWAKGHIQRESTGFIEESDEKLVTVPVEGRRIEDMEIVVCNLIEGVFAGGTPIGEFNLNQLEAHINKTMAELQAGLCAHNNNQPCECLYQVPNMLRQLKTMMGIEP